MNNEQLTSLLIIAALVIGFLVIVLLALNFIINRKKDDSKSNVTNTKKEQPKTTSAVAYNKQSIFEFMEFDKIEDNIICQKNGTKFLMGIECQGINYDLMSAVERNSVEEGFIQFLNTLRSPIQIYVQTRTVNLEDSIQNYKNTVEELERSIERRQKKYDQMVASGKFPKEKLDQEFYELTKQNNLYEYGKDIIYNTEKMSLNKNILKKQYYIIVSYSSLELGSNDFSKEEVQNIAFSELYTKAQSIIRTLSACEVNGYIMDSYDLIDLLYNAYNRDEAETYGIGKAILAGYDELYSTSQDVIEKKMEELNKKIEEQAVELANKEILKAKSDLEQAYEQVQQDIDKIIEDMAKEMIQENSAMIGKDVANKATQNMEKKTKEKATKGGNSNAKKERQIKTKRAV